MNKIEKMKKKRFEPSRKSLIKLPDAENQVRRAKLNRHYPFLPT